VRFGLPGRLRFVPTLVSLALQINLQHSRLIHFACVRPLPSAADQPTQPFTGALALAGLPRPAVFSPAPGQIPYIRRAPSHPTPSIPVPRPNPSVALAGRAPSTTNKTALVLLLPGLLCGVAGWPSSPAVRSGGKEADLLRARLQRQQRRRTGAARPAVGAPVCRQVGMMGCSSQTTPRDLAPSATSLPRPAVPPPHPTDRLETRRGGEQ
jgi:hypothetical protein